MVEKRIDAAVALKSLGIAAVDESELIALCRKLLAANPKNHRRRAGRQNPGHRRPHRPGQKTESERRPHPRPGDLFRIN